MLRSHLNGLLSGAVLMLMATSAAAQIGTGPIHIAADHGTVSKQARKSVYTGDVVITQGPVTLHGHKLTVYRKNNGEVRAVLVGDPAHLKRESKQGKPVTGHAQRVIYNSAKNIVKLVGKAFLSQGGNTLKSDTIRHNLVTGKTIAGRGEQGRVRITLQPDSADSTDQGQIDKAEQTTGPTAPTPADAPESNTTTVEKRASDHGN